MLTSEGVWRGSGSSRRVGGLYLEVSLQRLGLPFAGYILDPVYPVQPSYYDRFDKNEPTIVRDSRNIRHVVDRVSHEQYPYATDFLEEARAKGISRLTTRCQELKLLTPTRSTVLFLHRRGYLENWYEFQDADVDAANDERCRAVALARFESGRPSVSDHFGAGCVEHCSRHLWSGTAYGLSAIGAWSKEGNSCIRSFTDFSYPVYPAGLDGRAIAPRWRPGFIARFPITNFVRIRRTGGLISTADPDRTLSLAYPVHLGLP